VLHYLVTLAQPLLLSEPHFPSQESLLQARNLSPRCILFNLNNLPAFNLPAFNLNNLSAFSQLLCPHMFVGLDRPSVLFSHACKKHRGVGGLNLSLHLDKHVFRRCSPKSLCQSRAVDLLVAAMHSQVKQRPGFGIRTRSHEQTNIGTMFRKTLNQPDSVWRWQLQLATIVTCAALGKIEIPLEELPRVPWKPRTKEVQWSRLWPSKPACTIPTTFRESAENTDEPLAAVCHDV
jgi:hypothetical protein